MTLCLTLVESECVCVRNWILCVQGLCRLKIPTKLRWEVKNCLPNKHQYYVVCRCWASLYCFCLPSSHHWCNKLLLSRAERVFSSLSQYKTIYGYSAFFSINLIETPEGIDAFFSLSSQPEPPVKPCVFCPPTFERRKGAHTKSQKKAKRLKNENSCDKCSYIRSFICDLLDWKKRC